VIARPGQQTIELPVEDMNQKKLKYQPTDAQSRRTAVSEAQCSRLTKQTREVAKMDKHCPSPRAQVLGYL
jgi:hypothetical protein